MKNITLPKNEILQFVITGKFEAPSIHWKHARFPLSEYELFLITEGTLYLSYAGEDYTVKEGEYLLLPPGTAFREGFRESYTSFYWLHFCNREGASETMHLPVTGIVPKPEKLVVLMKQLQDMKKNRYPEHVLNAMTTTVICELHGQLTQRNDSVVREDADGSDRIKKQIYLDILDYIHTNIETNLKVSDVAREFGYNEKYLSHRFTEVSGISMKQYILKEKMDRANFYLTDTNNSVADIASTLGFSDSHNFCRTYKKITGLTPGEYRNAYSKRLLFHY